ncbi:lymphocyte cytosolic protein 2 [Paramisgurnus dabryanus]|uniref:lymphocyte cytosolic protein 2 n=1 Tax=Paramisgurnus dabryanus TaxID=90735 RepID=UPI0031F39A12
MSSDLPSKSEVMGWNSASLADYLKRMRLAGCDKVVKKSNMTGARFLNMSDKDLKQFPTAHIPYITKISKDINQNNKQRKNLFHRSEQPKPPKQEANAAAWDSDEFDQEDSDSDYEEPDVNTCEDNYICADQCNEDGSSEDDYEPPPTEKPLDIPSHFRVAKPLGDGDYLDSGPCASRDRNARPTTANKSASLPKGLNIFKPSARPDPSPHRPMPPSSKSFTGTPGPAVPKVDRSKKPSFPFPVKKSSNKPAKGHIEKNTNNLPMPPPVSEARFNLPPSTEFPPPPPMMMGQDMDPQWYVGQMSRGEAEVSLRHVNKDGAFLIRDSSKGCTEQPYTLMVLYQHKVYNIQIRFLGNKDGYSLGTGMKGVENFASVMDIVTHHMKAPLILIDGMDRGAGPQRQCCLMFPAGF